MRKKKTCWFDDQFKDPEFVKAFLDEQQEIFRGEIRCAIADTRKAERRRAARIVRMANGPVNQEWINERCREILAPSRAGRRKA